MKLFTKTIKTSIIFFATSLFGGCEGMSRADGIVISADTHKPLDSVELIFNEDRHTAIITDTVYSDSSGHFQIAHLVKCVPNCPSSTLTFSKRGYHKTSLYFPKQILDTTLIIVMNPIIKLPVE